MTNNNLQTEFEFILPKGLVDEEGTIHRQGIMRLATAKDEIQVQKDRRSNNPGYRVLLMLSQVIVHLGEIKEITPEILENLFTKDIAYLRELYNRINQEDSAELVVQCPQCSSNFRVEFSLAGES